MNRSPVGDAAPYIKSHRACLCPSFDRTPSTGVNSSKAQPVLSIELSLIDFLLPALS